MKYLARKKKQIPKYGTVILNGVEYYRTRVEDADGKRVALYGKTPEELYEKYGLDAASVSNRIVRKINGE